MVLEGILNRASLPSATRGRPHVSPSWCFPLAPQPWSSGCSEGLTLGGTAPSSSALAAGCSVQGWGPGPFLGWARGLELVFIPRPGRLNATWLLFSFSSGGGLLDPSSQQMKVMAERVARGERCPCQRKDSGLPSGELAQPASWMETVFEYTGCQSLPSLSLSFTHTLHSRPHTSLFHAPLSLSCLPVPPPLQPLFLLLPCLALTLTLGTTHSLYVRNSPSELAHEHTHSYGSGT